MNAAFVVKELTPSYNNFRSFQHQRQRNAATSTYHRSKTYDDSAISEAFSNAGNVTMSCTFRR